MPTEPLLSVSGLRVEFATRRGWVPVVEDVGFELRPGETLGLVGESGCGKTVTSLALLRLLPARGARIAAGEIRFAGTDLRRCPTSTLRDIRGRAVAMIFQEPMTTLNPAFTVGEQIAETVRRHLGLGRRAARARAVEMLDRVGIAEPHRRARDHPHRFSGGMLQRAVIAMALACDPVLLVADEPTTALDVTVQAQVLDLLRDLRDDLGTAMVFVTHDLGVVAEICDRVCVMYAGEIVEQAPVFELFARPRHPYTRGLLRAMPQVATSRRSRLAVIPGTVPDPAEMPDGCRFAPRCPDVEDRCRAAPVPLRTDPASEVRCLRADELSGTTP